MDRLAKWKREDDLLVVRAICYDKLSKNPKPSRPYQKSRIWDNAGMNTGFSKVYRTVARTKPGDRLRRFQLGKAVHRPYRRGVISIQEKLHSPNHAGDRVLRIIRGDCSQDIDRRGEVVQFDFDVAQPLEQLLVLRRLPDGLCESVTGFLPFFRCR